MGSPAAGLAATWASGLAALLVEGLARSLAALGAGWQWAPAPVASSLPQELRFFFLVQTAHHMVLETMSWNQGSELFGLPQEHLA